MKKVKDLRYTEAIRLESWNKGMYVSREEDFGSRFSLDELVPGELYCDSDELHFLWRSREGDVLFHPISTGLDWIIRDGREEGLHLDDIFTYILLEG